MQLKQNAEAMKVQRMQLAFQTEMMQLQFKTQKNYAT
jgi:hypothetical protein